MVQLDPHVIRIGNIFHSYALNKHAAAGLQGTRFVHYSRAEAAMKIISNKQVWMRKSTCMNDFMEVEHGLKCLVDAWRADAGKKFQAVLDDLFPGLSADIAQLFDSWTPHFRMDTYITCVSEHRNEEDIIGRLSMWRAYGSDNGIALVMNNGPFLRPSDVLRAYTMPVAYLRDCHAQMAHIAEHAEKEKEFLSQLGRESIKEIVFRCFRFAAVCTKHLGFEEEKEWRVMYFPLLEKSEYLEKGIEVINGVPQPVYKIPLKNIPEKEFFGVAIPELINRIIIGPTQYPLAMREAFVDLLQQAGVPDAANKVFMSDIPLRR